MSPEQARGKVVDKRTDVWAFGCVVYEMLTGRAAFAGDTLSDTIAAILEREPDWSVLPAATPEPIRRLLLRCLDKSVKRRLRDIGDARTDIDDVLSGATSLAGTTSAIAPASTADARMAAVLVRRDRGRFVLATAVVLAAIAGVRFPAAPGGARDGSTKLDRSSGGPFVCAAHGGRGACTVARRNQDRVRGARPRGKVLVGPVAGRVRREIADGYGRRGSPVLVTRQRRARVLRGWKPQDGETRRWRSAGARHWAPVLFPGRAARSMEW